MKLIDVKVAKEFASTALADPIMIMAVNAVLDKAPGFDLVRCKECKFWEEAYGSGGQVGYCINDVDEFGLHTIWYPDDF